MAAGDARLSRELESGVERLRVGIQPEGRAPAREGTDICDAKTGKVIKARSVTQRGEFVPGLGESIESAQNEAFVLLARDIVRLLEKDF